MNKDNIVWQHVTEENGSTLTVVGKRGVPYPASKDVEFEDLSEGCPLDRKWAAIEWRGDVPFAVSTHDENNLPFLKKFRNPASEEQTTLVDETEEDDVVKKTTPPGRVDRMAIIWDLLEEDGGWVTSKQLIEETDGYFGMTNFTFHENLGVMEEEGLVEVANAADVIPDYSPGVGGAMKAFRATGDNRYRLDKRDQRLLDVLWEADDWMTIDEVHESAGLGLKQNTIGNRLRDLHGRGELLKASASELLRGEHFGKKVCFRRVRLSDEEDGLFVPSDSVVTGDYQKILMVLGGEDRWMSAHRIVEEAELEHGADLFRSRWGEILAKSPLVDMERAGSVEGRVDPSVGPTHRVFRITPEGKKFLQGRTEPVEDQDEEETTETIVTETGGFSDIDSETISFDEGEAIEGEIKVTPISPDKVDVHVDVPGYSPLEAVAIYLIGIASGGALVGGVLWAAGHLPI